MKRFSPAGYYLEKLGQNTPRFDIEYLDPRHRESDKALSSLKVAKGFEMDSISKLCSVFRGKTAQKYVDAGAAIVKVRNVTGKGIDWDTEFVEQEFFAENAECHLRKDDIILTSTGDGTIGRVDLFENEREAMPDGHVTILRVNEEQRIDPTYLLHYLRSVFGQTQIERGITGSTGQTELSEPAIRSIQVVFPKTREEQTRYASRTYEGIKLVEQAEQLVEQKLVKVQRLLQEIVNFQLTTMPRSFYALKLTQSSERMDLAYNDPFYAEYEQRSRETKYPWVELHELGTFSSETKNPLETPDQQFLYVDIGNIDTRWGIMTPEQLMGFEAKSARMRRLMHEGEILVSTTRPTRRAIAIVPEELDGEICSTGFAVLRCNEKVTKEYLFHVLRSDCIVHQFERFSSGSGYPEINKEKDLPRIKVPCPETTDLQVEIVKQLESIILDARRIHEEADTRWEQAIRDFEDTLVA